MVVTSCIRFKSKKVAHFSHVKVASLSFFWLCFRLFPRQENLKGQSLPRRGSKNSLLFGRHTWTETADLNSSRSLFKDWRLAEERGMETLHPYISATCALFSPMFKILLWRASEDRNGSSEQEWITVPMNSEFAAKMQAFSSLRLTPAIEVTSFRSSSSLQKRRPTFYGLFRTDTRKKSQLSTSSHVCISYIQQMFSVGADRELLKALTLLQSASETLIWLMPQLLGMQILYMKLKFWASLET